MKNIKSRPLDRREFLGGVAVTTGAFALGSPALAAETVVHDVTVTAGDLPKRLPSPVRKWLRDLLKEIIFGRRAAPDNVVEGLKALEKENPKGLEQAVARAVEDIIEIPDDLPARRKITIKIGISLGKPVTLDIKIIID